MSNKDIKQMDIKAKIEELVKKITSDKNLMSKFKNDPIKTVEGYGTYNMPPGTWSDDSSMAIATLVSLCEKKDMDCQDMNLTLIVPSTSKCLLILTHGMRRTATAILEKQHSKILMAF